MLERRISRASLAQISGMNPTPAEALLTLAMVGYSLSRR
jgi:hypothetical protein